MKKTIKIFFAAFLLAAALLIPKQIALAAPADEACKGVELTGGNCESGSGISVDKVVATVINIFSWIVGFTAVIMIIIGGLKYVTSNGDTNNVNSAKNTILFAVIGLIVVAMAQVIVKFVLKKVY